MKAWVCCTAGVLAELADFNMHDLVDGQSQNRASLTKNSFARNQPQRNRLQTGIKEEMIKLWCTELSKCT